MWSQPSISRSLAAPSPRSCESQARRDRHQAGEGVEADVADIVDAVGQDRLDTLIEPTQKRGHRHGVSDRRRDPAAVAQTLGESLVDKDGNQTVLEQVSALLRTLYPDPRHQIGGRNAERHPYLAAAGAPLHPLPGDGPHHQEWDQGDQDQKQIALAQ